MAKGIKISGARLAANILRDTLATSKMSKEKSWRLTIARALLVSEPERKTQILSQSDLAEAFADIAVESAEVFEVLTLDSQHNVINRHRCTAGIANRSIIHPREAFRHAILDNAVAVAFAHNHPSGDPTPSADDVRTTQTLIRAGEIIGIRVLDHIVVSSGGFKSCN